VCRLHKTLYGLKQSLREWFGTIASVVNFDFQQCRTDPCIFVNTNATNGEKTYIALYVDKRIIAGDSDDDIAPVKHLFSEWFDMKDLDIAKKFHTFEDMALTDATKELEWVPISLLAEFGYSSFNSSGSPFDIVFPDNQSAIQQLARKGPSHAYYTKHRIIDKVRHRFVCEAIEYKIKQAPYILLSLSSEKHVRALHTAAYGNDTLEGTSCQWELLKFNIE